MAELDTTIKNYEFRISCLEADLKRKTQLVEKYKEMLNAAWKLIDKYKQQLNNTQQ